LAQHGVLARQICGSLTDLVVEHPADLDFAGPGAGVVGGYIYRLFEAGALDDLEAPDQVLGLGKGTVGNEQLATPITYRLGLPAELEASAGKEPDPTGLGFAHPGRQGVGAWARGPTIVIWPLVRGVVGTHQKHVLHKLSSPDLSMVPLQRSGRQIALNHMVEGALAS
jgi:hypothetical protein